MGFLDKAKKMAGQAKDKAGQAKELAQQARDIAHQTLDGAQQALEGALAGSATPSGTPPGNASEAAPDPRLGTPYVPGMLGRAGWRERGLADPAAILPITDRDRAGVPHSTKSQIVEEPFGMGRRWTSGTASAALFYQLYPEHYSWQPPGGRMPFPGVGGASAATLDDGRALVFVVGNGRSVVLESTGLEDATRAALAQVVSEHLAAT